MTSRASRRASVGAGHRAGSWRAAVIMVAGLMVVAASAPAGGAAMAASAPRTVAAVAGHHAQATAEGDSTPPRTMGRVVSAGSEGAEVAEITVHGRVSDASTGAPIADAIVIIGNEGDRTAPATRTDHDGRWRLTRVPPGRHVVRVRAIGYMPRQIAIPRDAGIAPDAGAPHDPAVLREGATTAASEIEIDVALTPVVVALDQVVVTASRREQRLADVAVTTEVVSRREIEQSGASDLSAVLTEQTGVQLQGGHPSGAGVMLQGIGSERVLILLDGQPLVGRLSGTFDLARIPTSIIERIEIVKGPQSTMYGSEAMGGVINIVTRGVPDAAWSAETRILAGTDGRLDGDARGTLARGSVGVAVDVGRRSVERAPGVPSTLGALAERLDAAARVRWTPARGTVIEGALLALDERQRWRSGSLYSFADNLQLGARAGASWLAGSHRLASTIHVSHFDHLSRASQYEKPLAGTGDRQTQRLLEAEMLFNGIVAGHALDLGIEAKQEYITSSDGRIAGGSRTLHSAEPFAQVELATGRWTVAPGARLSWNEQWGAHLTPRLALRVTAADDLTIRASAGRGFRAPDFKELYLDFTNDGAGYAVRGNPELRPERSTNVTAGAEWMGDRAYLRGQLFWNELHDFIETRPLSSTESFTVYTYGNIDRGRTRGIEVESGLLLGALRADVSWAGLDARDARTSQSLLGRPRHSGRVSLGYALAFGLRLGVTGTYTGRTPMQRDEQSVVTSERDAFARMDVRLAQRLPLDLELTLGADNLFDARPDEWAEHVGRQLYLGLAWRAEGGRR